ncbi:MAG TPA: alanine--tRNA ligase, partial [Candidatus Moranbacteria bacterium]|nr:alanine--tRNA ligase [Candidatus Moranbacteria bacterium]
MTANELRQKFLDFFKSKGHTIIPSASLIPEETDPSVLFTTAGMHPLVPYLLGEDHPGGDKVVNVQKCIRTRDIDEVGDNRHLTFFEMMGNWSFGDYFKKEAIEWSFEFLTDKKWLGLDSKRIYPTVFKGENKIPRDEETINIWKETFDKAGIKAGVAGEGTVIKSDVRIIPLGANDNFWIASSTGPCGPDTEMFY